jgi:hypothetical protein
MHNLGSHTVDEVRVMVEARGAMFLYLPPLCADLNPIEQALAKLETLQSKLAIRTVTRLWHAFGDLIHRFSPQQCLANAGFVPFNRDPLGIAWSGTHGRMPGFGLEGGIHYISGSCRPPILKCVIATNGRPVTQLGPTSRPHRHEVAAA